LYAALFVTLLFFGQINDKVDDDNDDVVVCVCVCVVIQMEIKHEVCSVRSSEASRQSDIDLRCSVLRCQHPAAFTILSGNPQSSASAHLQQVVSAT